MIDMKLELIAVPVTDVDRAKAFYETIFGEADTDMTISDDIRFIQFTPPGSACSICFGKNISGEMKPGSIEGLQLIVKDINEAKLFFEEKGIKTGDIKDFDWGRFIHFTDPDGNGWAVQQLPNYVAGSHTEVSS